MKNTPFLSFVILANLLLFGCSNSAHKSDKSAEIAIEQKFRQETGLQNCFSLNAGLQTFKIDAAKGGSIKTAEGAVILIAPGTFTDKNGNPVEGEVSINYKAMNTPAEIVASGIPMMAEYNGKTGSFVSDGMFDLQARSGNNALQIAQNKSIEVYTPSRDKESDFKYWYFDNKAGNWIDLGDRNKLNSEKDIETQKEKMGLPNKMVFYDYMNYLHTFKLAALYENEPVQTIPGKYDPNKQILDLKFNKSLYPEFAPFSKILWQFAGTDASTDPAHNSWIYQSAWQNVQLTPKNDGSQTYNLIIKTGGRVFSTIVKPVVTGKDVEKVEQMAKVLREKKTCENTEASASTIEYNMYNAFSVNRLGTYNCDRFYSDSKAKTFDATYELEGIALPKEKQIYFLTDNKKQVISFNANSYKLKLDPKVVDAVFIVAAQGAIAAISKEGVNDFRKQSGGKINLVFRKVGQKIGTLSDLSQAINGL